jgi:hypothetical protein
MKGVSSKPSGKLIVTPITSDALKIEPNRICPCAFFMTLWQFFLLHIANFS